MSRRPIELVALFSAFTFLAGCTANYDERIDYLREVGLRGIEVNNLLKAQESEVNQDSCKNANLALNDDIPNDISGGQTAEWKNLVEQTFMKACVLGKY